MSVRRTAWLTIPLLALAALVPAWTTAGAQDGGCDDAFHRHSVLPSDGYVVDVDVVSPDDVWAVGWDGDVEAERSFVLRWDGSQWTRTDLPPADDRTLFANAISAVSSDDVWVGGSSLSKSGPRDWDAWVTHWDGAEWSTLETPDPPGDEHVFDVHATGSDVWAVGGQDIGDEALLMRYDGAGWEVFDAPETRGEYETIAAVSGTGPDDIWGGGNFYVDRFGDNRPFVVHWDGEAWRRVRTPRTLSRSGAEITAVDAETPGATWLAGSRRTSRDKSNGFALIRRDSGWRLTFVPNLRGGEGMATIDAVSPDEVWMGGYRSVPEVRYPLAFRWDEEAWTRVPVEDPRRWGDITAIGAVGDGTAWAVGDASDRTASEDVAWRACR